MTCDIPVRPSRSPGTAATRGLESSAAPLGRMVLRALALRCPRCGGSRVVRSWFHMRHECPGCGLVLHRGEREDYWLGAYALNLVLAELAAVLIAVAVILATRPRVPWNVVEWLAAGLAVTAPIALFPFTRTLWLAVDLRIRPREVGDAGGRELGSG